MVCLTRPLIEQTRFVVARIKANADDGGNPRTEKGDSDVAGRAVMLLLTDYIQRASGALADAEKLTPSNDM